MMGLKTISTCLIMTLTSFSMIACTKKDSSSSRTIHRDGKPSRVGEKSKAAAEKAKAAEEARKKAKEDADSRSNTTDTANSRTSTDSLVTQPEGVVGDRDTRDEDDNTQEAAPAGVSTPPSTATATPAPSTTSTTSSTTASNTKTEPAGSEIEEGEDAPALADAREKIKIRKKSEDAADPSHEKVSEAQAEIKSDMKVSDPKSCQELSSQLGSLGWEKFDLEVPEVHGDEKSRKIHITYYKQKGSTLANPMLFIEGYFTKVRKARLESFARIAKNYQVDPILMDPRGWGCSSPLPEQKDIALWQHYGGRAIALDSELIRKKVLDSKKWKIWGHQLAGYIALRSVELVPHGISSIHLTDFTPMKDNARFMTYRIEAQSDAWKRFLEYAGQEKGLLISDGDVTTAKKTLKDKWPCAKDKSKLCGENVFDVFAFLLRSTTEWSEAAEALDALMKGELDKKNILQNSARYVERAYYFQIPFRIIDFDEDKNQTACARAIEWAKKNEDVKNSPINSCRIEVALGQQGLGYYQQSLKYDPYNHAKIKENLKKHSIEYYWMVADKSLFYPVKATEEHLEEYREYLKDQDMSHSSNDARIYEDPEFLQFLKPKSK